jgi:hypothetical protein
MFYVIFLGINWQYIKSKTPLFGENITKIVTLAPDRRQVDRLASFSATFAARVGGHQCDQFRHFCKKVVSNLLN